MYAIRSYYAFEEPTGPYKIGTVSYAWKDDGREELHTAEPGDKRELMIQIWYPASEAAKGKKAAYVSHPDIFAEGYSTALHMPKLLFTSIGYAKTHAIEAAELSDQEPARITSYNVCYTKLLRLFKSDYVRRFNGLQSSTVLSLIRSSISYNFV